MPAAPGAVDADRQHREQRARHAERHRDEVDRERAHERLVAADEPQALADRAPDRSARGPLGAHAAAAAPSRSTAADHREAARGVDDVRRPDAEPGDEQRRRRRARRRASAGTGRSSARARCAAARARRGSGRSPSGRRSGPRRSPPAAPPSTYEPQSGGSPANASAASAGGARRRAPIWSSSSSIRRSKRSAMAPPSSDIAMSGTELDRAEQAGQERRPRLDVDLERQRDERRLRAEPGDELCRAMSSRRSREARSGETSMTKRLNGRAARARRARPAARCPAPTGQPRSRPRR